MKTTQLNFEILLKKKKQKKIHETIQPNQPNFNKISPPSKQQKKKQQTIRNHSLFFWKNQKKITTDVDGIKYVINFDYPQSSEDYIHRIGRTGRSDTTGTSYTFFTNNNAKQSKALLQVLREANQVSSIFLNSLIWFKMNIFM